MSQIEEVKTTYAIFGQGSEETDFLISIEKKTIEDHGTLIVLRQGDSEIMFPATFAKVIKDWAKGEKA
jgi:hypothetical protein